MHFRRSLPVAAYFDASKELPFSRSDLCNHHHHHSSLRLLAYRAARKLLHPYLSLASLWMSSQQCSSYLRTVLRRVVFGRPRFRFPSGVLCIATLVMELTSLCGTCPIQHHRFLGMMVSIPCCWLHAKWRWFLTKRCAGFSRGLSCERTTALQGHARSSASTLIHTEGPTIRSSCRVSA